MAKIFIIQQLAAAVIIIIVVVVGSNKNLIGFSFITAYNSVFIQKCVQKSFWTNLYNHGSQTSNISFNSFYQKGFFCFAPQSII